MRLDELLVLRGLASTVEEAQRIILAGEIRDSLSGEILSSVGRRFAEDQVIERRRKPDYVGRGYLKLGGLFKSLPPEVLARLVPKPDAWALDIGASTGGFTEVLLEQSFSKVVAVDVGRGQLHEKLRRDPRVIVCEQKDSRDLRIDDFTAMGLKGSPQVVTVDISFNSIRRLLPTLQRVAPQAVFILLFKPQFEISRSVPKPGGRAPEKESLEALKEMLLFLKTLRLDPLMIKASSIKGREGNQETFIVASDACVPKSIFRTYDIRGVGERDLNNEVVARIARAFGRLASRVEKEKRVIGIGHDQRLSSPRIFQIFSKSLREAGIDVVDLGDIPTPMAYFAHYHFDLDGIVQITASHNPKDDNGFKMMLGRETLFGDDIQKLYEWASEMSPGEAPLTLGAICDRSQELRRDYLTYLKEHFPLKRRWKLALDCGNGMVGSVAREAFTRVAESLDILYEEVDCRFPHHEADPTVPANLVDLQALMSRQSFDLGFAFDGDGDRLGVVTSRGRILWGDEILMLLAERALLDQPGATIIGEVKCSEKLFRQIRALGGQPLMYKTGHSLIKKKMKEMRAPIAGEMSGHLFFADRYFGYDDATYAAFRVMEAMEDLNIDLDTWIESFPASYVTPELRLDCAEEEKSALVQRVKDYFHGKEGLSLNTIDGIRVGYPDSSWALVRASNTQAVLVIRIEGSSGERIREIQLELEEALDKKIPN